MYCKYYVSILFMYVMFSYTMFECIEYMSCMWISFDLCMVFRYVYVTYVCNKHVRIYVLIYVWI